MISTGTLSLGHYVQVLVLCECGFIWFFVVGAVAAGEAADNWAGAVHATHTSAEHAQPTRRQRCTTLHRRLSHTRLRPRGGNQGPLRVSPHQQRRADWWERAANGGGAEVGCRSTNPGGVSRAGDRRDGGYAHATHATGYDAGGVMLFE